MSLVRHPLEEHRERGITLGYMGNGERDACRSLGDQRTEEVRCLPIEQGGEVEGAGLCTTL